MRRRLAVAGCMVGLTLGMSLPLPACGQDGSFVGGEDSVGSFERSDPVLADEVMTGLIPSGGDEGNDFSPFFQPALVLESANRTRYSLLFDVRPSGPRITETPARGSRRAV